MKRLRHSQMAGGFCMSTGIKKQQSTRLVLAALHTSRCWNDQSNPSPLFFVRRKVNGVLLFVSFLVLRVGWMGWFGVRIFYLAGADFWGSLPIYQSSLMFIGYIGGYLLQLYWFRKVANGIIKAFINRNKIQWDLVLI